MKIIERSVQEIGKSFLISLPKGWADAAKIKKGSLVKMIISDSGGLAINPEFNAPQDHLEVTLPFDEFFSRRFFREYFHGNEKITFLLDNNVSLDQRKQLSLLLSKFMNVQVIEETSKKVAVKCFKIEELSIQDCMNRMFYLSLNIFDEYLGNNDKIKMSEVDDSITRFYFMLVMQIRRYLTEGKYTEQNQISLTRAMDFRMVAEKVEKTADILKGCRNQDNSIKWKEIKDYYNRAYLFFSNKEYDKSLGMMTEHQISSKKLRAFICNSEKVNDLSAYKQAIDALQILNYSKEIVMLVR